MNATPHDLFPDSGAEVAATMPPMDTTRMMPMTRMSECRSNL